MVKKFEFKDNDLKLDIAGEKFKIDTTNIKLVERVSSFGKVATKLSKELEGREDYVQALKETIDFCQGSIDSILGKGATKQIFKNREVSLLDLLDVINYIMAQVKEDRDKKFQVYSPNRAQRRAKK